MIIGLEPEKEASMIIDTVKNLSLYASVLPQLKDVVKMVSSPDLDLNLGSHETAVPGLRYNVVEHETLIGRKDYEVHGKEVDIHIMLEGTERVDMAQRVNAFGLNGYDAKRDIAWIPAEESFPVVLRQGMFALILPGEPHKPGMAMVNPAITRKLVFKLTL